MLIDACRWVRRKLPLLAGGDLLGPERRRAERHLVGCPDCRRVLESLRSALDVLHASAEASPVPAEASAPLWPALERQIRESRRPLPAVWPRVLTWAAGGLVAASIFVAGALSTLYIKPAAGIISRSQVEPAPRRSELVARPSRHPHRSRDSRIDEEDPSRSRPSRDARDLRPVDSIGR
jgi:anti-sigma factor RsiW